MLSRAEPTFIDDDQAVYGNPGDLTPWDVRFDPSDRAHLDTDSDGSIRVRVWSDPALVDGLLVVRSGEEVSRYDMTPVATTSRFTFWEVVADVPDGISYSFAFRTPNGRGVYRVPDGITNAVERLDRWTLAKPEPLDIPAWAAGSVIYQIFPDRFARRPDAKTAVALESWDSEPTHGGFKGGNLGGIVDRLDHLVAVGADIIYLNPVFEAPSNHRYDTIDYLTVDPLLGGNAAFDELIAAAHDRSLKVIIDTSFNHVHTRFFAFRDVIDKGPDSPYWDWFIVHEWPIKVRYRTQCLTDDPGLQKWLDQWKEELGVPFEPTDEGWQWAQPTYDSWYGVPSLPRVDVSNADARRYMLGVTSEWLKNHDLDGWRMDVVRYVDADFWNDFRVAAKQARTDAYLLCEIMGDASSWLQGDKFDATMNYTFRDLCVRFLATEEIDGHEMLDGLARSWAQYAWPVTLASQNLIGSHDTPRFLTEAGGEVWRLDLATVMQLTFPGAPGVLYGDEMELEGGHDPGMRAAFPWNEDPDDHLVFRTMRDLTAVRRSEPALVTGEWRPLNAAEDVIAFSRVASAGRTLVTVVNRSHAAESIDVGPASEVVWGRGSIDRSHVRVEAHSAVVVAR